MRMVGGREVALGLGSIAAGQFEPSSSARTWLAASMLSDAVDGVALATAVAGGSLQRRSGAVLAASAALLAGTEAALLTRRRRNHAR